MEEGRVVWRLEQCLARRLWRLDEVAEEIVVLDLELPDAGLIGVGPLEFGNHATAFVAQAPRLFERGQSAGTHKPAISLEKRQLVREHGFEIPRKVGAIGAQPGVGAEQFGRQFLGGFENVRQRRRRGKPVANGGEVAGTAAIEAQARERPQKVGRMCECSPQGVAHRRCFDQEIERIKPSIDRFRIRQRARQPFREQACSWRSNGQVDCSQERALARAAQGSRELEVGAGRRIDFQARPARPPDRRRERRPGFELGALDVGERERRGGDLGVGEGAEAVEGFDPVEFADATFSRRAVAAVTRERRSGNAHLAGDLREQGFVIDGLRRHDLARLQARDFCGEAHLVGLAECNRAGRQIERGEPVQLASAQAHLLDGDKETSATGLQQPFLGDRSGCDQPNDIALDDRLRSPLFRRGRVFQLLAHSDAVAESDQPVEVVVGALDGHPAHADVLAVVLAALREDNAERPARDFRVVEEQLVEIAHPVEQQATGIDGLDLQILRHHRRDARAGLGIRAAGGVHRLEPSKSTGSAQRRRPRYPRVARAGLAGRSLPGSLLHTLDQPCGCLFDERRCRLEDLTRDKGFRLLPSLVRVSSKGHQAVKYDPALLLVNDLDLGPLNEGAHFVHAAE